MIRSESPINLHRSRLVRSRFFGCCIFGSFRLFCGLGRGSVGEVKILAIDPGPLTSAFVVWNGSMVLECKSDSENERLFDFQSHCLTECAIEKIASYGMAVGAEVFETCVWTGRFIEKWRGFAGQGDPIRIPRLDIKVHLCKTAKAKDTNIRQALIDRFGPVGTRKTPGPLFGVTSHCWAALAVAVTCYDRLQVEKETI